MKLFSKSGKLYTNIPQLGKHQIPKQVLFLIGVCSACFLSTFIIGKYNIELRDAIRAQVEMPTKLSEFTNKPWTLFTSIFFHRSGLLFLANMIGILVFGNFTSMLFSKKVVIPLFVVGGLMGAASIWIFKILPLTQYVITASYISGASGGMMTLAILSSFYMPEQIVRLYGVYPLKLKFIGRALLLFSVVSIFLMFDYVPNFLHLGGALAGYIFLVLLKRNKLVTTTISFSRSKKIRESAEVVELKGVRTKPMTDEQFNDIRISKKEYLDHLLDKINREGMDSLSHSELEFLNRYANE